MITKKLFIIVAATFLVVACGSTSGRSSRSTAANGSTSNSVPTTHQNPRSGSGGGLWDMLAQSKVAKEKRLKYLAERDARLEAELARGTEQLDPETRRKFVLWWSQFIEMKPEWLQNRFKWRAMGQDAREILGENLIIAMVRAWEHNNGLVYKSARSELFEMPGEAIPYLVSGLAARQGDAITRKHCVDMLGWYGAKAIPAVRKAYARAETVEARLDLLRAVKGMKSLGAPDSVFFLSAVVNTEEDFRLRLAAIQGLGLTENDKSIPLLIKSLSDDDLSVRKFSAGSLGHFKGDQVIEALILCMEKSEAKRLPENREGEVAGNCRHSLRIATGQNFKRAGHWRNWWNQR